MRNEASVEMLHQAISITPGETANVGQHQTPRPTDPPNIFKWTRCSYQLHGHEFALVMLCLFSEWVDAFPRHKSTALTVAKKSTIRFCFPHLGNCCYSFKL